MQQPRLPQEKHSAKEHAQQLGAKSGWEKFLPIVSWMAVFATAAVAFVGGGQFQRATAAGIKYPPLESEAGLATLFGQRRQASCVLIVPQQPLTAKGLATPYQLTGSDASGAPCHEANSKMAAFVQAAVLDPATGRISIYNPLVIDRGTQPAVAPVIPTLPANAVVGVWFGSNGTSLRLRGADFTTLFSGRCVDGLGTSNFGQVAYCNAAAFFSAANRQIQQKRLTPPALGTANDGLPCPSVRDFSVVDQDQSDNVTTTYRVTQDGRLAQNTAAAAAQFPDGAVLKNASDNRLVAVALDAALGCSPWMAPDLANPGQMVPALPLAELQAAMYQAAPVALVPSGDPMTLVNGRPNLLKQNLYRVGVDQPPEPSVTQATADNRAYCQNVMRIAPARLQMDQRWTESAASPDPTVANSLYTFMAARLSVTIGPEELNCTGLLGLSDPVQLTEVNGVVVDATFSGA